MKTKKLSRYLSSVVGIVIVAIILIIVNLIVKPFNARIDCTSDKLYTLSDGTKSTLKEFRTCLIRFYYEDVAKCPSLQELRQSGGKTCSANTSSTQEIPGVKLNPKSIRMPRIPPLDGIPQVAGYVWRRPNLLGIAVSVAIGQTIPFLSPDAKTPGVRFDLCNHWREILRKAESRCSQFPEGHGWF